MDCSSCNNGHILLKENSSKDCFYLGSSFTEDMSKMKKHREKIKPKTR